MNDAWDEPEAGDVYVSEDPADHHVSLVVEASRGWATYLNLRTGGTHRAPNHKALPKYTILRGGRAIREGKAEGE